MQPSVVKDVAACGGRRAARQCSLQRAQWVSCCNVENPKDSISTMDFQKLPERSLGTGLTRMSHFPGRLVAAVVALFVRLPPPVLLPSVSAAWLPQLAVAGCGNELSLM
mmetsp:Transcript_87359/g.173379  ORF Transcript_87359/g.173379 Transcript_87359/m.173379 type:complete len:109 (-) Transcript_87359:220-546(-)